MVRLLPSLLLISLLASANTNAQQWPVDIKFDTFGYSANTPSDYPWADIIQACARRDCIPAIDKPVFISAQKASFLWDDDIVIALVVESEARAYPIRILVRHELVNDTIAGQAILVSYCPLCGSGLIFSRVIDNAPVEFGVSGLLHNSDLVMYDRETASLWQQITGTAFAGEKRKQVLPTVPSSMTTWLEWRTAHPDTQVLSLDTGLPIEAYERWPYGDYAKSERLMFPVSLTDARQHPKMVVYGVEIDGQPVAYAQGYLREKRSLNDKINGRSFHVAYNNDGSVSVTDTSSNNVWMAHRLFWFAWYSFHPDTLLRKD